MGEIKMEGQEEKRLFRHDREALLDKGDLKGLLEKSGELHGHLFLLLFGIRC
jgi:hypothetical protein